MDDPISRQNAINTALEFFVEFLGGAFHVDDQRLLIKKMNEMPSAEPQTRFVAEITLTQDQIQDAVDKAVDKMRAELAPCDFCKYKDDCGDMAIYCPAERRTDE